MTDKIPLCVCVCIATSLFSYFIPPRYWRKPFTMVWGPEDTAECTRLAFTHQPSALSDPSEVQLQKTQCHTCQTTAARNRKILVRKWPQPPGTVENIASDKKYVSNGKKISRHIMSANAVCPGSSQQILPAQALGFRAVLFHPTLVLMINAGSHLFWPQLSQKSDLEVIFKFIFGLPFKCFLQRQKSQNAFTRMGFRDHLMTLI